jgi:hypothetical protein
MGRWLTVEDFVLTHTVWVPVSTEADDYQALVFGHDGLVDVPSGNQVRKDDGTHDGNRTSSKVAWWS